MSKNNLNVLITRPEIQGRVLVTKLAEQGINACSEPMFDYQLNISSENLHSLFHVQQPTTVIFVSTAAVEFAHQAIPLSKWPIKTAIAVGTATQKLLQTMGITAICPQTHNTEGMLALEPLQQVADQQIFIVRGDGGRELLAQSLTKQGAKVTYIESYQRVWRSFNSEISKDWQQRQINCIVVTSIAILEYTLQLLANRESYWREQCLWVVASERIAQHAHQAGLVQVINADGASDQAIMTALSQNGSQ